MRDAEIDGAVDHPGGLLRIEPAAELIAAKADQRYAQAGSADFPDFHV
jgi:hypothetical protein